MRRDFGMSAREVLTQAPAWELDVLIDEWNREQT